MAYGIEREREREWGGGEDFDSKQKQLKKAVKNEYCYKNNRNIDIKRVGRREELFIFLFCCYQSNSGGCMYYHISIHTHA